ncbi:gliding motility protein GldN [Chryseobacterium taklimakanense]|uniref:Gliding motility associated protein GldN n=1 Tax=Chryseobacterium taklimakanense TaxID=536441 RepID=A0A239XXA8_9FLAO|nr:gliding motility protein GldN [Chryseobacterium taklimakanense]MCG7280110.1 gliding motility protein GldN [Chryseobacterium taklimakanense]SNV50538.1 gliding motility associated protein GldN [Chryseobacterium taklimakanense]
MKKLLCSLFLAAVGFSQAQSILNAKSPEEFRQLREENKIKKGDSIVSNETVPLPYGYIDEKDILKSMVVWEIIDLNDKLNQPLYHNSDGLVSQNKSLYQILIDGIKSGKIEEVYDDEMFTTRLGMDEIQKRISKLVISDDLIDKINSGATVTEEDKKAGTDVYETKSENVKLLKIKGMWYIDRRDSQMKYRLLGIAAMGKDPQTMGVIGGDGELVDAGDDYIDLFWVFYPNVRPLLVNSVVFNNKNLSSDITYDDILNARRFSSVIYKSDNGLGNGVIKDYIPRNADEQMEEHERIKAQILQMENDMWNY